MSGPRPGGAAQSRFVDALRLLRWIEWHTDAPRAWRRRAYRTGGLVAVQTGVAPAELVMPPAAMARSVPDDGPVVVERCRAEVVRIGKFDLDEMVRFRAFHCTGETPTALRVQGHESGRRSGMARAVEARSTIATHVPALAPPLLDFRLDERKGFGWLREGLVAGRHPRTDEETQDAVRQLAPRFRRLYETVGVSSVPMSTVVGDLLECWAQAIEAEVLPESLWERARRLVARDASVEVSLGHGDLVRTNMIQTVGGVVLVDWEKAGSMLIAADFAKLLPLVGEQVDAVLDGLRDDLRGILAPTRASYSLEEQVAFCLIRRLSTSAVRAERAGRAGRQEQFDRSQRQLIALLEQLLPQAHN